MRKFRGSGSDAADRADAQRQLEDVRTSLRQARADSEAKDHEIRELRATVQRLEIRLGEMKQGGNFVESHGVLWQRAADGRVDPLAYCPTCRLVMTPLPSGYPERLICTSCTFKAAFHPEDLPTIMEELTTD